MDVAKRQEMERQIVRKVIDDALAAGYSLDVWDGEEDAISNSTDAEAIFATMFACDEEWIYFRKNGEAPMGWVYFIYGECGHDVINNYTCKLEDDLKGVFELADQLEAKSHA